MVPTCETARQAPRPRATLPGRLLSVGFATVGAVNASSRNSPTVERNKGSTKILGRPSSKKTIEFCNGIRGIADMRCNVVFRPSPDVSDPAARELYVSHCVAALAEAREES
jgi:hypothetical protein